MPKSTLTSKGQVTVPKTIRDRLGLETGDQLEFSLGSDRRIMIELRRTSRPVVGLLHQYALDRPTTVEDMKRAVRDHVSKKHSRPKR